MISVLIVDDHEMVRLGVSAYLDIQEDIQVVGEAENGLQGLNLALDLRPDIILMDLVMDVMDGIEASQRIMKEWPEARIIIVTSFLDDEKVYPAIEAGAKSYILKTSSAEEIAEAIRETYRGEQVMTDEVNRKLLGKEDSDRQPKLHDQLTQREFEVLQLVAQGQGNQEIADELFISLKTVKSHISSILNKLEVKDRTQAAVYAYQNNLVKQED